jgi:ADP-ribose pyrophosphatase YjhB (NUDIX family)
MFSGMNAHEKTAILGKDFLSLWLMIFPQESGSKEIPAHMRGSYFKRKNKFYEFCSDIKKMNHVIYNSSISESPWEAPKGRRNSNETVIDTAIREFQEETNIPKKKYKILWHEKPIRETYEDCNVRYINTYFMAVPLADKKMPNLKLSFSNYSQVSEVDTVRWVIQQDISSLRMSKYLESRTKKIFKRVETRFRTFYRGSDTEPYSNISATSILDSE